ncbi:MAG: aminotransferase class I/II-fold pyridoxal phosphate-dependent enzyme [Geodermatophilaceae bacterium]|nr:aminotransferase class I/II-fold pyridoxal phosphate-dependent enzyme [Geodermatophilaceae bacterium]
MATFLSRVRGAMTVPDAVVMVSGVVQALTLLIRTLLRNGVDSVAVEDPSKAIKRQLLARLGMRVINVPVDDGGLRVDALATSPVRVVLCTPAHQYPTGVALSSTRRENLLHWVRDVDGLVIEDDYDSEFRHGRAPLACLQGMDSSHAALMGSVSKTMAPALRLG